MGIGSYKNEIWAKNVTKVDWQTTSCKTVTRSLDSYLWDSEVEARLSAVEEIKESTNYKLEDVAGLFARLPDLEKGLVRIHYGRVYYS